MNRVHHFGDSYSTVPYNVKHFVNILSDKLNYTYVQYGVGGSSNEQILTKFLRGIYDYQDGDVLFFNFSFFVRGTYYDRDRREILSSNFFVSDKSRHYRDIDLVGLEYIMSVFDYHINNMEDYNRKIFDKFDTVFELLVKRNISIYYIFNENSEFSNDLLKYGKNIIFPTGFCQWLHDMDYHREEECHYTRGVQDKIYDSIIDQLDPLVRP